MANQIKYLLCYFNKNVSIREITRKRNKKVFKEYLVFYTLYEKDEIFNDNIELDREKKPFYRTIDCKDYILSKIIKIEKEQYSGTVYNFEVEKDNSYCVNGFAVHNCESAACGLPVIASRYSGQTDFCNDENSYLVDVDGFSSSGKELSWISYFYENAEFPIFGPKAIEQTRYYMRRVYENYSEAQQKAKLLREKIITEYNWNVAIDKMSAKLKDTYDKIIAKKENKN